MSDLTATIIATPQLEDTSAIREAIDKMGPQEIELRRNEILRAAAGDYEKLTDLQLHELAYIASKLRRTAAGPPKEAKAKAPVKAKSIDDLI